MLECLSGGECWLSPSDGVDGESYYENFIWGSSKSCVIIQE